MNAIGHACVRSSGRRTVHARRGTVLLISAWLLGGLPPTPASAQALRWKFMAGEVMHYSIDMKTQMSNRGADRERKSSRSQIIDMSWSVRNVAAGGEAEITQRIDRVRMKSEAPPYTPFEFDSSNPKSAPTGFEDVVKQLEVMVGAEFTFKIKPSGEIGDIKFPEQTLKRLREAAPRGAPESEVSEQSLKEMLLQSSPPSFPEGEVEPGKSWKSKPARLPMGFATMVMDRTFTFQGPDPKQANLLLVGMETKVALEPAEGANIAMQIRKQEGRGSIRFDGRTGHMANTESTQKIDMAVTVMGQSLEQTTETTTSMTLAP